MKNGWFMIVVLTLYSTIIDGHSGWTATPRWSRVAAPEPTATRPKLASGPSFVAKPAQLSTGDRRTGLGMAVHRLAWISYDMGYIYIYISYRVYIDDDTLGWGSDLF